jgi:hypothetical protein
VLNHPEGRRSLAGLSFLSTGSTGTFCDNFDYKYLYNFAASYSTPWYSGRKGILGHVLGGYKVAPLFFAQSGAPVCVGYAAGSIQQAFGQSSSSSISGPNYSSGNCALPIIPGTKYQFNSRTCSLAPSPIPAFRR